MTIEQRFDNLQSQLNTVCELLQLSISSLNTKKSVAKFLNKSDKTIHNYIKNGTFTLNKHYFINENKRVEFIPFAIVEFKKNPKYDLTFVEEKIQKDNIQLSEVSSKILKGIL